jgi:hypothetical protein
MKLTDTLNKIFSYKNNPQNFFIIPSTPNNIKKPLDTSIKIYDDYSKNIDFLKSSYSTLINSDIVLKEFKIKIAGKSFKTALIFVDGMVDSDSINGTILKPLLLKNNTSPKLKSPKLSRS